MCLPLFVGAACEVIKELHEPVDASGRYNDGRPFSVLTFFRDFEIASPGVFFEVQIEQLALDLSTHTGMTQIDQSNDVRLG